MKRSIPSLALILLLTGCVHAPSRQEEEPGSGSILQELSASSQRFSSMQSSMQSSSEEEYDSPLEAMELSYGEASRVRDLTLDIWEEFTLDEQEVLIEVLEIFSDDIDLLEYYIDVAQREQLTEEDKATVADLMLDIEQAMDILASAIEALL